MLSATQKRIRALLLPAALLLCGAFLLPQQGRAQIEDVEPLPAGVRVETVLRAMTAPVAFVFDPAGRVFYTEKTGAVRLFANGELQQRPVIVFDVATEAELGLTGIEIDPDFKNNGYIYVYYTCRVGSPGCPTQENRVVRFIERDGAGRDPVTIFSSPQPAVIHAGGGLHFGPDGKLYVSVGEGGSATNAQDLTATQGKVHRINRDGSAPEDNPRFDQEGALPTIYAIGLRNSFNFTFDPVVRGRIFASENGPSCDDELNRIEAGYNYGWRPGYPCDDADPSPEFNSIKPLWYVPESICCLSPTGVMVYTGDQIPQWRNHLFMASFNVGALFHFVLNQDRTAIVSVHVVDGVKTHLDMKTGPDGAFYFIEEGGWYPTGSLKRIVKATNPTPTSLPSTSIPGEGSQTFPETGKTFSGIFLDSWKLHGGLMQQGFPISELMKEVSSLDGKSYTVQYFERAVFEYHPEEADPQFMVLLSQLGTFQYRHKYFQAPAGDTITLPVDRAPVTSCPPTQGDPQSPTYKPDAPVRSSVGAGHVVTGSVLSSQGCAPIAGAMLEMWPETEEGHLDEHRATLFADADGRYRFETPVQDHIHMRISAHGYSAIFTNRYHVTEGQATGRFDVVLTPDPSCRLFAETGRSLCGSFRNYWEQNGALMQQGFPISGEFDEKSDLDGKTYRVQYFERAVFEHHPENKAPFDVLLSQLGSFRYGDEYGR